MWKIRKIFWILIGIVSLILLRIAPTIAQNILGVYILGGSINMTGNSTSTNYNYNFNYTYNYNASNQTAYTDLNMNGYSIWNASSINSSKFCIGSSCVTSWSSSGDNTTWNETMANGLYQTLNNATFQNIIGTNQTQQCIAWVSTNPFNYYNSSTNTTLATTTWINSQNFLKNNTAINTTILNATKLYASLWCLNPSCLKNMTSNSTHIIIQNGG